MEDLSYQDFVRAHDLPPLVDLKRACAIAGVSSSRLYELRAAGIFRFVKNGSRSNVTAMNLYQYYCSLISAADRRAA
jgi:hypothetical protein